MPQNKAPLRITTTMGRLAGCVARLGQFGVPHSRCNVLGQHGRKTPSGHHFSNGTQATVGPAEGKSVGRRITYGITAAKLPASISEWYCQVVIKANFIEYYDISGFFILKPQSVFIWGKIKGTTCFARSHLDFLQERFGRLSIDEYYFPLLAKKEMLDVEKEHLSGFTQELAWITKLYVCLLVPVPYLVVEMWPWKAPMP